MRQQPKTLQQAIVYFSDPENCLRYLVAHRWPHGVICPMCGRKDAAFLANQRKWQCKTVHAKRQFSVKVGTIFEDSPLGLDKWLAAAWLVCNCKNGISSYEIHRALGVTQKTAWFMLHRIRLAMQRGTFAKIGGKGGAVEVDETFVGGRAEFMHLDKRTRLRMAGQLKRGPVGKAIVLGLLDRNTNEAKVKVIGTQRKKELRSEVREHVHEGTAVYTDALKSYRGLPLDGFIHDFIDHAEEYVRGEVHTNGLENFWSLFKRALKGTYVSVEPFHLQAYADEQAFRFNNRKEPMDDTARFSLAMSQVLGKRITYAELTGRAGQTGTAI